MCVYAYIYILLDYCVPNKYGWCKKLKINLNVLVLKTNLPHIYKLNPGNFAWNVPFILIKLAYLCSQLDNGISLLWQKLIVVFRQFDCIIQEM